MSDRSNAAEAADLGPSRHPEETLRVRGKLMAMAMGEAPDDAIERQLLEIANLPYVASVLALPDVHQKARMEVPSSIAVATRGVIVPEFTSVAVNDGMGVVTTTLKERELTTERMERFLFRVNSHSAANFFDRNRYSISVDDLRDSIRRGGRALLERYRLDEHVLERMEGNGGVSVNGEGPSLRDAVPYQLLPTPFSRSEMGLNFGGNHFLEVQVVDRILDAATARRWGFEMGQVVIMYHLGPGPFSGTLLHHYSHRTKIRRERVPIFLLSKLLFHYVQRGGKGDLGRKWWLHFRKNRWTAFPAQSDEGRLLRGAVAMATNFGYAYRLATVRAIYDGVHEAISRDVGVGLFCDISHNGIQEETWGGKPAWVARHNACRLEPGKPTIVAGSYDVPSFLGIGEDGMGGRLTSYDHGAGNLIERYRASGRLARAAGTVSRFTMTRGRDARVVNRSLAPCSSSTPIDRLMECLEMNRVMRSVLRLRPIGNLKN